MKKITMLIITILTMLALTGCRFEPDAEMSAEGSANLEKYSQAAEQYYNEKYGKDETIVESYYESHLKIGTGAQLLSWEWEYDEEVAHYKMSDGYDVAYRYEDGIYRDNAQERFLEEAVEYYVNFVVTDALPGTAIKTTGYEYVINDFYLNTKFDESRKDDKEYVISFMQNLDEELLTPEELRCTIYIAASANKDIDKGNATAVYNRVLSDDIFKDITIKTRESFYFIGCVIENGDLEIRHIFHELNFDGIELKLAISASNLQFLNDFALTQDDIYVVKTDMTGKDVQEVYRKMYVEEINDKINEITGREIEYKLFDVNGVVYKIIMSERLKAAISEAGINSLEAAVVETNVDNVDIVNFDGDNGRLYDNTYLFVGDYKIGTITVSNSEQMVKDLTENSLIAFEKIGEGAFRAGEKIVAKLDELKNNGSFKEIFSE